MPNYTENYNLKKPLSNEYYSIEDQNDNMDIIDQQLKANADEINAHKAESASKHIKESGSNVNGRYIKFDDGTMICWLSALSFTPTTMTAWGVLYHSDGQTWTFPHAFINSNIAVIAFPIMVNGGKIVCTMRASSASVETTKFNFWNVYSQNTLPINEKTSLIAIGRWK